MTELSTGDTRPIHSVPYPAGPKAVELDKNEIAKVVEPEVIELALTE